jgi:hypothetical protein
MKRKGGVTVGLPVLADTAGNDPLSFRGGGPGDDHIRAQHSRPGFEHVLRRGHRAALEVELCDGSAPLRSGSEDPHQVAIYARKERPTQTEGLNLGTPAEKQHRNQNRS